MNSVAKQYEKYPYPGYNLLAAPDITQHFMASSSYASKLWQVDKNESHPKILMAGCGDSAPLVLKKIESKESELHFVDISKNNLTRAKKRILIHTLSLKNTYWYQENLETFYLERLNSYFSHVDCFGVLHHLKNPEKALKNFYKMMKPHATMRVMVYNSKARSWIHKIQDEAKQSGLTQENLGALKDFLKEKLKDSSFDEYNQRIKRALSHPTDLIDTFFHAYEARRDLKSWLKIFEEAGFYCYALWDRYDELDIKINSLNSTDDDKIEKLTAPNFLGNYELYLAKIDF